MTDTHTEVPRHPARFNPDVLVVAAEVLLGEQGDPVDHPLRVLDPFAGTGRIHSIADHANPAILFADTFGVELEPEWADAHERTQVGNALDLATMFPLDSFDAVVTSPCYGNRMADHHNAADACKKCDGMGCEYGCGKSGGCENVNVGPDSHKVCRQCTGSGLSKRNTYKHALGRDLTEGSAAMLQWGTDYRRFHTRVWAACLDVLKPGGLAIINVKNHVRDDTIQRVCEWHCSAWLQLGCYLHSVHQVATGGLAEGDNYDARVPFELVMAFRVPDPKPHRTLA